MSTRSNRFRLKRSNIPNKIPTTSDLLLGELALNTYDVILYGSGTISGGTGTTFVRAIGWDRLSTVSGGTVNGSVTLNSGLTIYNGFTYPQGAVSGYVWTTDSLGNASWQPPTGAQGSGSTYYQVNNYTANVPVTINHNLNTTSIITQIIDTNTNQLIYGDVSNYQLNSVDVTLSTNINNVKVIVAGGLFVSTNSISADTYVTGFTYSSNNLTINQNNGQQNLTVNINNLTGLTVNGSLSATTYLGLPIDPDNYVTGGTYSNGTLTLNRQNGSVIINGFFTGSTDVDTYLTGATFSNLNRNLTLSQNRGDLYSAFTVNIPDTYVTGFTYSTNNFVISQNNGLSNLTVNINNMTGLTVNGSLSATTYLGLPIDPDTYVTGFTYGSNNLRIQQNNNQSPLVVNINNLTGLTVNGSLSATTYLGLPVTADTYTTGFTYTTNNLTIQQNNNTPPLVATISSFSSLTITDLVVTNLTATTVSATTIQSPYKTFILTSGSTYSFTDFRVVNTISLNKTTSSITTIFLPSNPNTNDFFTIKDRKGDSFTYPITVSGSSKTIDGSTSVVIKQKNNPSYTFLFDGEEYIII